MTWGEAIRLTQALARETSSHVHAALAGWDYPAGREALALMDLYDAFVNANFKRPKSYPRPWPDHSKSRPKPTIPQADVIAALRQAGHMGSLPRWAAPPSSEAVSS